MKKLLSITAGLLSVITISAQCPQITCPGNITVNNDTGTCGAVVNYVTPVGTNPCGFGADTFYYTGSSQNFTVPNGVTTVTIETRGAQGAQGNGGAGGMGARMIGDFTVVPGQILSVIVGGSGTTSQNAGGGGGGSGVIDGNTPLCIAGGGGGGAYNEIGQPALTTTSGGNSSGLGGTAGNGGQKGYQSGDCGWAGGGGGFLGDGYGGNGTWDGGALPGTLSGPASGKSHLNGGAGGTGGGCQFSNTGAGGYGCGGGGRGEYGGGGGGGYSGGGGGQYVSGVNQKGGGGGGSINSGSNQSNTQGYQSGNGLVIISWTGSGATTTQTSGLPDGGTFPVGVTTNWYKVEDGLGNSDSCSFTVTVVDNEAPSITCPGDTTICWGVYNATITTSDNCPSETVTQVSGPTLGSSFDVGTYNLEFVVTDASGNKDTCDYNVTVEVCGGVNENQAKYSISVYPNPMQEFVIIENKHITGKYTIEITNTLGAIVKTINTSEKRVEIQKGNMSKGMYYYNIKQNGEILTGGKLAVE